MSAVVGLAMAIATGFVSFALSPFFDAVGGAYILPAQMLIPLIEPLIPTTLVYWVVPDGGAPAGMLLIVFCVVLFWTLAFGVLYLVWRSLRVKDSSVFGVNS